MYTFSSWVWVIMLIFGKDEIHIFEHSQNMPILKMGLLTDKISVMKIYYIMVHTIWYVCMQ